MFSRYKKTEARVQPQIEAASATPIIQQKPEAMAAMTAKPKPAAVDQSKDNKRRERLSDIRIALHKRLLDTLNLAALEYASESDLRTEIAAICADGLIEMGVVLNKDERQTLHQELFDEVTGLGPLEPLLRDDTVNDILVNGPQQVFIERAGKLELSDVNFKDEKHLMRIIDKIVSAVGRRVDESNPYVDARLQTARVSTRWSRRLRSTARWCPFVNSRKTSWGSRIWSSSAPSPKKWPLTCRPRLAAALTSSFPAAPVRVKPPR